MRNIYVTIAAVVFTVISFGANAQQIGIGAGAGYQAATGDLAENGTLGFLFRLEGNYYINEKIGAGIEYQGGLLAVNTDADDFDLSEDALGTGLYLLKGEYFLKEEGFRPYGGLGLGLATYSTPEITVNDEVVAKSEKSSSFAISPRVGFDINGFGLEFQYNLTGKQKFGSEKTEDPFNTWNLALKYIYRFGL